MAKLFKKGASEVPEDLVKAVIQMKQAGYSENEIIQALREQGYSPQEIQDSLAQAEQRGEVEPYYPPPPPPGSPLPSIGGGDMEENVSAVVEDRLRTTSRDLQELKLGKDKLTSRVDRLEQSVDDLKKQVMGLNRAMLGKVEEYEKSLLDVGTELKAMQKVFKDSLPELTNAISELTRHAKGKK